MNHLAPLRSMRNRYYLMRHGESGANVKDKIVSRPAAARQDAYGLTEHGQRQVIEAAKNSKLSGGAVIYSSDFTRARETAEIVRQTVGAHGVQLDKRLRERDFGDWEDKSTANYESVWRNDALGKHGDAVESPDEVLERTTRLVAEIESQYSGRDILLVAHGDTLQILQCGFYKISPAKHRSLPHLGIAEVRQVLLKTD